MLRDFHHAGRRLLRSPAFSTLAVLILALGIGANTAMFSVVNAVVLRPLPLASPDRLVRVWHVPPPHLFPGVDTFAVSPANYLDWRAQNDVFERMTVYTPARATLTGNGEPDAVTAASVSAEYFDVLGVRPLVGRFFAAGEDADGRDGVVVLSEPLWRSRYGGDASIVGRSIQVDGRPRTVIGVAPRAQMVTFAARLWMPLVWTPQERATRGIHDYLVVARLRPGVDVSRAQAEMTAISRRLEQQYPADDSGWGALVVPLREDLVGGVRTALFVLLGAVGLVMLIACANVMNLLLARMLGRSKEMAVRTALGASRWRVMRQALAETLLLGLAGGAAGLLLARTALTTIVAFAAQELPRAAEITMDTRVLLFTLAAALFTGVAAGLAPAWRLTRTSLQDALKQGLSRTTGESGDRRVRNALVVAEVALALMLLVGAGLLIRTLSMLRAVDPGFDPSGLLTMTVEIPHARYPTPPDWARFFSRVQERLQSVPGVDTATAIDSLPTTGGSTQPFTVEGEPAKPMAEQPEVAVRRIAPAYFHATRTRLVAGREFDANDTADRQPVVIVSESMARRFWPDRNPIGRHLTLTFYPGVAREIVGVVADVKLRGLQAGPVAALYVPVAQQPGPRMSLVVRGRVPAATLATAATAAVHEIDADQPVLDVRTMDDVIGMSIAEQRFAMRLLAAFAAVALLLAALGIYSVLSYTVRQRTHEIGLRMALGAPPAGVVRLIVFEGAMPTVIGVAVGLMAAAAVGRVMSSLIYGVSAHDGATLATVAMAMMLVGVAATLLPAYRATRVDPLIALRDE